MDKLDPIVGWSGRKIFRNRCIEPETISFVDNLIPDNLITQLSRPKMGNGNIGWKYNFNSFLRLKKKSLKIDLLSSSQNRENVISIASVRKIKLISCSVGVLQRSLAFWYD
jgi:hypothetical protein